MCADFADFYLDYDILTTDESYCNTPLDSNLSYIGNIVVYESLQRDDG